MEKQRVGLHKRAAFVYDDEKERKRERKPDMDERDFELLEVLENSRNIVSIPGYFGGIPQKVSQGAAPNNYGPEPNLYRQMVEGSLDAAIIRGDYNWDGARFLLSRERVCVICARGLEEIPLKNQIYIGRKTDSALETATLRWMNEQGLDGIHTGLSVDSITTCVEMVRCQVRENLFSKV